MLVGVFLIVAADGHGDRARLAIADFTHLLDARPARIDLSRVAACGSDASARMQRVIVSTLIAVAIGRGVYVTIVEHAGEPIVRGPSAG